MDLGLEKRITLVTGSTQGIGYAIATALRAEGADVVVNGRSRERVDDAVRRLSASPGSGEVRGIAADLGTAHGADTVVRELPEVDVLVNNVGIFEPKAFVDIEDADWQRMFDVNVMSGVRLSRAYLPRMLERDWGRIVFISSESGVQTLAEMVHYGMTKSAQIAVARGIAEATAGTGVTVNSVLPGPTASEGVETFVANLAENEGVSRDEVERDFFASQRPTSLLQRFQEPEEIAVFVALVASPRSSGLNGAALRVDGGVVRSAF